MEDLEIPGVLTQIFQGISAGIHDILPDIHPESQDHVNDDWRTQGKEGNINEPHPDPGCGNPQFFANGCTDAKCGPFHKTLYSLHEPKIGQILNLTSFLLKFYRRFPGCILGRSALVENEGFSISLPDSSY